MPTDMDFLVRCLNTLESATEQPTAAHRLDAAIEEYLKRLGFIPVEGEPE